MKTSDLSGAALDWAVAKCEGYVPITHSKLANVMVERADMRGIVTPEHISSLRYSTRWAQGGPIIEREGINLLKVGIKNWRATMDYGNSSAPMFHDENPLIAAMRCYIASKLGDKVEIPKNLQGVNNVRS